MKINGVEITTYVAGKAMIAGLINIPKEGVFEVDMNSFGRHRGGTCFGCAATCALQELTGVRYAPQAIGTRAHRAKYMGLSYDEVRKIEIGVNDLRAGDLRSFGMVFGLSLPKIDSPWYLSNNYTTGELQRVGNWLEQNKEVLS